MQSFHLHSIASPSCVNLTNPNFHKIPLNSSLHYPSPREDVFSDALLSLRKCTEIESPGSASCHHARVLKLGIESDAFIGNALLNMYSKCNQVEDAQSLFDQMPHRTTVSWTSMMSAYHRTGEAEAAIALFRQMLECVVQPNEYTFAVALQACALIGDANLVGVIHSYAIKKELVLDDFLQKCLIDAYAKSGMSEAAEKLLQRLSSRDVVSWTSVISGCVSSGNAKRAFALFREMQKDGIFPNEITMVTVFQVCSDICSHKVMQGILGLFLKGNWCVNCLVLNSLIKMYLKNGKFAEAMMVFSQFCFSNDDGLYPRSETMANLLLGCVNFGSRKLGEGIHGYLIKHRFLPCIVVENSLINMYAKTGQKYSALLLFRKMLRRDVISWNAVINGFVKNNEPWAALRLFIELCREGSGDNLSPDFVTVLTSLEACSELSLLLQGQAVHGYLVRTGLLGDVFVQNALIDLYAKSGRVDFAESIFIEMLERDIGSWNSIIAAYGSNGNAGHALTAFSCLDRSGTIRPNAITFINVLAACAHAGLVQEGFKIFDLMERRYGVKPSMEHYGCMVDLLGRAGEVEEAERFIHSMVTRPSPNVWVPLLSACVLNGNIGIAERAAKELAVLEPGNSAWRVALANAYASVGRWEEAAAMRAVVRKEGGWSSVNVGGREMSFVAGDTKRPERALVYEVVSCLKKHMKDDGSSLWSDLILSS